MKKFIIGLLAVCFAGAALAFSGCRKNDPDRLEVIWDSIAFIYSFDDIDEAIRREEARFKTGAADESVSGAINLRKQIDNTKLMADWAREKSKSLKCVDWGWGDPLTQKLTAAFLAGQGPDIVCGEGQLPQFMEQDQLEAFPNDLTDYIKANVSPVAYNAMSKGGKIYGISLCPSPTVLVWNKDILRAAGVSETVVENGPATWAEWTAAMERVRDMGDASKLPGGVYYASNPGGYLRVGALLNGANGGYAGADGKPSVNTAENGEALRFVRETAKLNNYNTALKGSDTGYFSAFKDGHLAYILDGTWAISQYGHLNFDLGYSYVPGVNADRRSDQLIGAGYMAVPKFSRKKELAFECLKRMLQGDIQQNLGDGGIRAPVLKSVYEGDAYKAAFPKMQEFAAYAADKKITGLPAFAGTDNLADVWAAFGAGLHNVTLSGNTDLIYSTDANAGTLLKAAQAAMTEAYNA
ncbi:MAG: extracellular solute-binding protein [Clostridiales bacterium]|jgi:multiple sugar transport system substrate-binding protein|nr:extracellular solute-binding protein [Clostridiales bacterium]